MKNLFLLSASAILVAAAVTGCTCCGNETVTPCSAPCNAPAAGFAYSGVAVEHPHKVHHVKHHHAKHHPVKHHHKMPCPAPHKAPMPHEAAMPKGPAPMPGAMPAK